MIDGVLIAGGTSSRFGSVSQDKALVDVEGVPMIRRVADALVPVVDRVVVNARPAQADPFEAALSDIDRPLEFAVDRHPKRGPVAGLDTALDVADGESALVLACDFPLLKPATLSALHARLERTHLTDSDGAEPSPDCVLPIVDGKRQPLCGAYGLEELTAALAALEELQHSSFDAVLSKLDVETVPTERLPGGSQVFLNVNRPTDLRTARDVFRTNYEASEESSPD